MPVNSFADSLKAVLDGVFVMAGVVGALGFLGSLVYVGDLLTKRYGTPAFIASWVVIIAIFLLGMTVLLQFFGDPAKIKAA
jgi:hypothetical protein